jgi:hypothetical protein
MAIFVRNRLERIHSLRPRNSLFQRLDDLFVVLPVGGRVFHALAVEQRDTAPLLDQPLKVRWLAGDARAFALRTHGAPVRQKLVENCALFLIELRQHRLLAVLPR